jgi:hypothetical protein
MLGTGSGGPKRGPPASTRAAPASTRASRVSSNTALTTGAQIGLDLSATSSTAYAKIEWNFANLYSICRNCRSYASDQHDDSGGSVPQLGISVR